MKRYEVHFLTDAVHDIDVLFCSIAEKTSFEIAAHYLARIERLCLSLERFLQPGTSVAGEVTGLRRMGFERRVTILFQVGENESRFYGFYTADKTSNRCWTRSKDRLRPPFRKILRDAPDHIPKTGDELVSAKLHSHPPTRRPGTRSLRFLYVSALRARVKILPTGKFGSGLSFLFPKT